MAVNLSRNTRVFFTTLDRTVDNPLTGFLNTNTYEIKVMDGYSFSQSTEQQTITLSEAGTAPIRGERSFNSKINPVEWSLSTYIRPYLSGTVTAPEKYLWNAAMGSTPINTTSYAVAIGGAVRSGTGTVADPWKLSVTGAAGAFTGLGVGDAVELTGMLPAAMNGIWPILTWTSATQVILDFGGIDPAGASNTQAGTAKTGSWYETASKATSSTVGSNKNQLEKFGLVFKVDNTYYKVHNCAVNQAEVSFDLQGIAMIAWSGFGTELAEITDSGAKSALDALTFPSTADNYITNKLSTTTVQAQIGGGGTTYTVPITGGNLTINNNIEYITPENLGDINKSIGYFTGSRSITGALNAYLKTGANESGTLLANIVSGLATSSETKYKLQIEVGGISNPTRVELKMDGCQLQVPTVEIQDVVSTTINFTAQGFHSIGGAGVYEIGKTNNLVVSYYGVA